jgi:hypothetical protein
MLMLFVALCLCVRTILSLVDAVFWNYLQKYGYDTLDNIGSANKFMNLFTSMGIYIGVALVATTLCNEVLVHEKVAPVSYADSYGTPSIATHVYP